MLGIEGISSIPMLTVDLWFGADEGNCIPRVTNLFDPGKTLKVDFFPSWGDFEITSGGDFERRDPFGEFDFPRDKKLR